MGLPCDTSRHPAAAYKVCCLADRTRAGLDSKPWPRCLTPHNMVCEREREAFLSITWCVSLNTMLCSGRLFKQKEKPYILTHGFFTSCGHMP
eukprot:364001-Chlamydomonas_euryale.AAC.14